MTRRTRGPEARSLALRVGTTLALRVCTTLALLALLSALGCARKQMPSGGPPDTEPPRVLEVAPDSGATNVSRSFHPSVEFSEGMDPRTAGLAVELAPRMEIKQRRWSGRKLTLVLADSLAANQTYTMFVGADARDRHGNALIEGRTVPFSTASRFPPGVIAGEVGAVGFPAPGTFLWCYPEGHSPDSTARDFEAVGLAGDGGRFNVTGLHVPGRYRVWAFADLNHNHSFEPGQDLLVPADTTLELTVAQPVVSGLRLHVVNPRAPGHVKGTVLDTLKDERGLLRLIAWSVKDTTRRILYDVDPSGGFDFTWDPGTYKVRAFRDLDKNKSWKRDEEPASEETELTVQPGGVIDVPPFVLVRAPKPAPSP